MSNEIDVATAPSRTVYVLLFDSSGQVYDGVDTALETYATAQRDNYDIALTEQGTASGVYLANFPTAITAAGTYVYYAYIQLGGSPAETDTLVATGKVDWSGTAEVSASPGSMAASDFRDYVLRGGYKRTDKDTELYEAVTDTIQELRRRFMFQEAETESTITDTISVDGDYKMDVESDFGLLSGVIVEDGEDAWTLGLISKSRFDQLYPDANVTSDRGIPTHMTLFNDQILVGPVPDKTTYVYRKTYSTRAGTVSASTTAVPFTNLYREMLRDGTLARLWELSDEYQRAEYFYRKFEAQYNQATNREDVSSGDHVFAVQPDPSFM